MKIETARLRLRSWEDADREAFAALHADSEVMHDYGGPIDRAKSDAKFDRYVAAYGRDGFSRWAVETLNGDFIGYVGVMNADIPACLGRHAQIGWRLHRSVWGLGYASEAALAALRDVFARCGLPEVLAYTGADNARSQAVMRRLDLYRDPTRDFEETFDGALWQGMVWVARARDWAFTSRQP